MEKVRPNIEVKVKDYLSWEPRYAKDNMVYVWHNGELWPQWPLEKYHSYRWLVFTDDLPEWQTFNNRKDVDL